MTYARDPGQRFRRIGAAGMLFQGGAAAADTSTIVSALVHSLTGSVMAVGAAAAIGRYGWLFPQLFVAYFAQRRRRRMPFYMLGAFGRVACLSGVALVVAFADRISHAAAVTAFFALWTLYAFVSGIVAVPYNDIVARSVPTGLRSRLLALRFFGGGLLALGVAAGAHRMLESLPFPVSFAAVLALGTLLLLASALTFAAAGEPLAPSPPAPQGRFSTFLRKGFDVVRSNDRFRWFVYTRWLDGAATMALPLYIIEAGRTGLGAAAVAYLLAAQTAGALAANPLWGWWGDRYGKRALLEGAAACAIVAPALTLAWIVSGAGGRDMALPVFLCIFFVLGAVGSGGTIAQLGYLMEISPDERRPAYSGYFNAIVAPASLAPIAGAALAAHAGFTLAMAASALAACLQWLATRRLRAIELGSAPS